MILNIFKVGPFTGNVTTNSIRIWAAVDEQDVNKVCIGHVRWKKSNEDIYPEENSESFEIEGYFDGTGIIDVNSLSPSTRYDFQSCYSTGESQNQVLDWPTEINSNCSAKTSPLEASSEGTSFILGSCRDHADGKDGLSDKTFKTIYEAIDSNKYPIPDISIMTGDQIYSHVEENIKAEGFYKYRDIYRQQFTETNFSKVMKILPSYFQMDDHEVQNDWGFNDFKNESEKDKLDNAMRAYNAYQASLCPVFKNSDHYKSHGNERKVNEKYWYDFKRNDCDFFVMDVRHDRKKENDSWSLRSTGGENDQLQDLLKWIHNANNNKVNFIVTPVPMFPDPKKHAPLSFPLFILNTLFLSGTYKELWVSNHQQRKEIIDAISRSSAKFAFLSGDVHCSFACSMQLDNGKKIHSIVSSAFNWMLPGVRRSHFNWKNLKGFGHLSKPYEVHNNRAVQHNNNYTLIKINSDKTITVTIYDGHSGDIFKEPMLLDW